MMTEAGVVYVGSKPFMNYVTAVVMQFTTQNAKEVVIKARGRYTSRAIDVVELVRKRFLAGQVDIKSINIDSEEFQTPDGRSRRVSTIEIVLAKKE
jgi:DNA-binding protein